MLRHAMISTIMGLAGILALAYFVFTQTVDDTSYFWNPKGLAIVLGGTFAATFVSFRSSQIVAFFGAFVAIFRDEQSVPIRLTPIPTRCRALPLSRI